MNFNTGWHVLYVKSRYEKRVHESLKNISLESFLPQVKVVRQWSDRKKVIYKPLFPSYVFVHISNKNDFHNVLSISGISNYIKFGKDYAIIKNKEIEIIKLFLQIDGIEDVRVENEKLKIGEVKKIIDGPLIGLECEIIKVNNKNTVSVYIGSLRQKIKAIVPCKYLAVS